ncbi:dynamin family protein [Neobacillus sp. OS1-33]|uniref:dynamin family protein n=1 Tax=Neobacillus sp. OS1-33 TaxID=3070683 RepID=UPI0027E0F991|nr:dynamin family protein [Neobacillus sp. OS1-33]WML25843.1 dynamin family protein [Neobacillus sp. OS1-33]
MVKTADQKADIQTLKTKIVSIYEFLSKQADYDHAEKVKQLAIKLKDREFMIAFCGHFSAGKSTMINQLVGENLLPASPIPTSANLVKVKAGEEYAKVFFKNEKPRIYLAPYNYEIVKNYCKDGDQIEEIEISHSDTGLPANTVIMDTPGIDSADDAHRIATESALHLADIILYVMDYNHVQAELNFLFTKELTQAGKEVYLVINQIDKHNEEELSFFEFQSSVVDSFASWGVKPARIFYTSLKNEDQPFNEFKDLKQFIAEKLESKDQLLVPSIFHSLKKITQDHLAHSNKQDEIELSPVLEILNELSEEERRELSNASRELEGNLTTLKEGPAVTEKEFDHQITQILKNAYLMPFQTRELAERYLESCQLEYKVGILFSKQKTLDEKKLRLESFHQDILDKTKSQLEWHIREFLLRILKETGLNARELQSLAQSYSIDVQANLLSETVKSGARVSGEYVLHYTEDVANEIKKIARQNLALFKEEFLEALRQQTAQLIEQYEQDKTKNGRYIDALTVLTNYQNKAKLKETKIEELLAKDEIFQEDLHHLFSQDEKEYEVVRTQEKMSENGRSMNRNSLKIDDVNMPSFNELKLPSSGDHLEQTVERLQKTSSLIQDLPGFRKLSKDLVDKAERLENKGFTVALFGAFSAGKSSFANALMGAKILPVSPNPTTAAINKIKPVTETHPHGTVLVKFKEAAAMLEDINRSLRVFELQAEDFEGAAKKINELILQDGQDGGVLEKTHFTFLQAFTRGYQAFGNLLGTILETDVSEFTEFVANEEKSCYVEWIELYYDCELTKKGITLVDTPGADSINARHTGVAFDYIKNSDACFFVTYYNHAFSKADREFLIQLGRVKESFQMDKLFFIINAIDLAENEEEKDTVLNYVEEQLGKYGIRNPHLYPVSSLQALKEKVTQNPHSESGMANFEQAFYHFITNELTEMAISSAEKEITRVYDLIDKLIKSSQEDQSVKEKKRGTIEKQKARILVLLQSQMMDSMQNLLNQEADELVYYIKQRVFLRFGDFFRESFNPATLKDDGRNLKKVLLAALDEFLESLGFDFAQEMRATTVRLERFAEKQLADYQSVLIRNLQEINQDLSFSVFEVNHQQSIEFPIAFKDMNKQLFTKALSYFKNPKSFFEKNEKKFMSDELYQVLNIPVDEYLTHEAQRLKTHYSDEIAKEFNRLLEEMNEQVDNFYLSHLSALDGGISIEYLRNIQKNL